MRMCEIADALSIASDTEMLVRIANRAAFRRTDHDLEGTADPYEADTVKWGPLVDQQRVRKNYSQLMIDAQISYVIYSYNTPVAWWTHGSSVPYYPTMSSAPGHFASVAQAVLKKEVLTPIYTVVWENAEGKKFLAHYNDERDRDLRIVDLVVAQKARNVRTQL